MSDLRSIFPWRQAAAFGIATVCLMSSAGAADYTFEPAFATPLRGPATAKGAIIWNHGKSMETDDSVGPPAVLTAVLRDDGWDVFRLRRPIILDSEYDTTNEILAHTEALVKQGYAKVVLAGQSFGAWTSLIAAGKTDRLFAVIANAPAAYGDRKVLRYERNASILYSNLEQIHGQTRIILSFFKDDSFDPGGRGPKAERILTGSGVPHLIIDQPEGFSGHGSGSSGFYARRFGACMIGILDTGTLPTQQACDSNWGRSPSAELTLPVDFKPLSAAAGSPFEPFLGRWYGIFGNGREILMSIERVDGDTATTLYATGPMPGVKAGTSFVHRSSRIQDGALVLEKTGAPSLKAQLASPIGLNLTWTSADGTGHLESMLARLP